MRQHEQISAGLMTPYLSWNVSTTTFRIADTSPSGWRKFCSIVLIDCCRTTASEILHAVGPSQYRRETSFEADAWTRRRPLLWRVRPASPKGTAGPPLISLCPHPQGKQPLQRLIRNPSSTLLSIRLC